MPRTSYEGFKATWVANGLDALDSVNERQPSLVVLDVMLPGIDGLEVCRRLRERGSVPLIMLTALGEESDRIAGLELGADDYVLKPFSPRELMARIRSVLRRAQSSPSEVPVGERLSFGHVEIDVAARQVTVKGNHATLTAREFDLLLFLASHPRHTFSRGELLEQVWGYSFGDRSTVTVHVRRLREKVEPVPSRPIHVVTVWGVGYRLDP